MIERYARSAIGKQCFSALLDGFSNNDPLDQRVWEDNFRVGPSSRNPERGSLVLVKLHGSVNWCSDEETEKVLSLPISLPSSVTYKIDASGSMFLYPAYEKDIVGKRIYSDLFYHLDEYISKVPNWVFAGFAFKDAWVNSALEHSFRRSPAKKNLVIVNPSVSSEDLPEALKRARRMELGLEDLRQAYSPLLDIEPKRKAAADSTRDKAAVVATGSIGIKLSRPNLVAYWRLTSESVDLENRLAVDIGPNHFDGIISGAEFRSRPGLFFDGSRSLVDIGSHEHLIGSSQMTILARVFLTESVDKRDQVILASQGETNIDFIFGLSPNRRLFLEPNPWPYMFDLAQSGSEIPEGSDHWVGVTADWEGGTSLHVHSYLDGKVVGQQHLQSSGEMHPLDANQSRVPNSVSIGASIPGQDLFTGFLRDVQLYNAVLPAATIEALHNLS